MKTINVFGFVIFLTALFPVSTYTAERFPEIAQTFPENEMVELRVYECPENMTQTDFEKYKETLKYNLIANLHNNDCFLQLQEAYSEKMHKSDFLPTEDFISKAEKYYIGNLRYFQNIASCLAHKKCLEMMKKDISDHTK